jgi:formate--tetrahydrofolate ligase
MAILAMTSGIEDLRARLGRIVVGETASGRPVTAEDLRVAGAMAVLMRHAVRPNLVQTLEGRPALVHSGPFGNIASGNSSVLAARVGMKLADVVVTEAGFGSDLGFEKFCHLVAPAGGMPPSVAVIVATVRALRMHGGLDEVTACAGPDPEALKGGSANLAAHIDNVHAFGLPAVVAVNRVEGDADAELEILVQAARDLGAEEVAVCDGFGRGGAGAEELAKALLAALERPASFAPVNPPGAPVREQIERIATRLYGADGVELSAVAERSLARLADRGLDRLPVCMAKSHLSLSHDPALKARPRGFTLPVRDLDASVGAGFVIVLCGDQLLMPGLGREPAFTRIDVDDEGNVVGLS